MQSEQRHCGCDPEEMKADASYQYFVAEDLFRALMASFISHVPELSILVYLHLHLLSLPTSPVITPVANLNFVAKSDFGD